MGGGGGWGCMCGGKCVCRCVVTGWALVEVFSVLFLFCVWQFVGWLDLYMYSLALLYSELSKKRDRFDEPEVFSLM